MIDTLKRALGVRRKYRKGAPKTHTETTRAALLAKKRKAYNDANRERINTKQREYMAKRRANAKKEKA